MRSVKISGLAPRMTSRDAGFLYLERPHALLHIGCVAVVDGRLTPERVARRVEARLPRMRRYAQRAVPAPLGLGHPAWEDDPELDVRAHIARWTLPSPGGDHELRELTAALLAQPLARDRPLWEMHVIDGLDGDRSALFQKVHHCMVDGMAGAQALDDLLDTDARRRDVVRPRGAASRRPTPRHASVARSSTPRASRSESRAPGSARCAVPAKRATRCDGCATRPSRPCNWPHATSRRCRGMRRSAREDCSRSHGCRCSGVRRIRAAHGGTVNDVVLCALAGGLHRYLRQSGVATRGLELTALVPVSLRGAGEARAMGNRISAMLVPLAVDPHQELPRLAATRALTDRLKTSSAWTGIDALLGALDGMPPALVATIGRSLSLGSLASVIATNVPGPRETRWLCGKRVEALYPIVPIVDGIGLGLAVFSYDGFLHIGLNADAALVPDLEKLEHGILEAFGELLAGA